MPQTLTQTRMMFSRRGLLIGAGALAAAGMTGAAAARPGRSAQAFAGLQRMLDAWVAQERLPGAAVAIRRGDGQSVFLQAGRLDYDPSAAMVDHDTLFRIYSMTKPVTGVCAALLMEDGLLTLDTPVAEFVPEFANLTVAIDPAVGLDSRPATQTMTVRHLLTHTSGLTYHIMGENAVQMAYRRAGIFPVTGDNLWPKPDIDAPPAHDLDQMAQRLGQIPLVFEPGSAFEYSCSLDVLGLVIQRASGMPFADFMRRRLLEPAGMTSTKWTLANGDPARLMQLYDHGRQPRVLRDDRLDSDWAKPVTLPAGGAGLLSTPKDYLAFLTLLLDGGRAGSVQVMKPETARLVMSNILPPGVPEESGQHFGFGGSVDPTTGEYGWSGAAGTLAFADPTSRTAVAVMIQELGRTISTNVETRAALAAA